MATRYAVASGDWSNNTSVWSDTDGGAAGNFVPADGDTFVISAAVNVKMDADQSAFTGLAGNNIIRGGATPGMLYWCDGDSGYLKLRTAATLQGTTDTNRGRLLANSDGTWATTTGMAFANKAVILLEGTAQIQATNLDIIMRCTHPTTWSVRTYKTKQTVVPEADDDTFTCASHGWANATALSFKVSAGGSLPTPIQVDTVYYVVSTAANTFKVAAVSGGSAIDLTTDGSGTIEAYDGHTDTGTATMNVLEDVTGEAQWVTTDGHDAVVLVDCYQPSSYDQQRLSLVTINAGTIVLSANVDSAQYPGARIFLSSRNVSIRSSGTSATQAIVLYLNGDTHGGIFDCEMRNTAGSGTTFYSHGVSYGLGHTISGTISGCNYGINYGSGHTISGTIIGCSYGIYYGSGNTISGTISGCNYGINSGSGHTISGTISGCSYGIQYGSGNTISGTIIGCNYGIYYGSGYIISGTISGCSYSFRYPFGDCVVLPGATVTYSFYDQNVIGQVGRVAAEEYGGTPNAYKIHDNAGDIIKTACDGTGDAPSVDPDAGNGYCIEASNIQSNCGAINKLVIFDKHRIWFAAGTYTVTYKVQTTYAAITAGNLKLSCRYIGTAGAIIETTNAPAIAQRSDDTDWTQTLAVTFTSTAAGWADFKVELMEYESGNEVYIWPTPAIS